MGDLADDLVAWMDAERIESDVVGGFSFGGALALYLARHHPDRVRGVVALAAKHVFDAATLEHWTHLVTHERLARLQFPWGPRTAELSRIHAPNTWQAVADPAHPLRAIPLPAIARTIGGWLGSKGLRGR